MNRILKKDNSFPISNAKKIVDLRNVIIHGYDRVTDEVIWGIIVRHIPLFKLGVTQLLAE
jgi:uncharacterized protein with HEPN domain